jgi:hypothetical protein
MQCHAPAVPVEDDARRYSSISNNSDDGAACSGAMSGSHPHMPLVRCNAMAWTDETEEEGARSARTRTTS